MRKSGILMPLTSLPSPFGIGGLGREAYEFADFLEAAGQSFWQILPLNPTGFGNSPYQSFSVFAFNIYMIDPETLRGKGLLSDREIEDEKKQNIPGTIDYTYLYKTRFDLLKKAAERFEAWDAGFVQFEAENAEWLNEYSLFMAIKEHYGNVHFKEWPVKLRNRDPETLQQMREKLASQIHIWKCLQFFFSEQWFSLKKYLNKRDIKIIGDLPIYVSPDSVELWSQPQLFQVDRDLCLRMVAGCPPDGFSPEGQHWGNPVYDWEYHVKTNFEWWVKRLEFAHTMYDKIRLDHFRGFAGYYSIPAKDKNAVNGMWREGPGMLFVDRLKEKIPREDVIAEDLGFLTSDVKKLLADSGFPGMKVLQFAFDNSETSDYLPHKYKENSVVYTGTHDNTTTAGWEKTSDKRDLQFAKEYLTMDIAAGFTRGFIKAAMRSVSDTAIIPVQDWLGLGEEARINTPSTVEDNWKWRLRQGQLTDSLAKEIYECTRIYGRLR